MDLKSIKHYVVNTLVGSIFIAIVTGIMVGLDWAGHQGWFDYIIDGAVVIFIVGFWLYFCYMIGTIITGDMD